MRWSRREFLRRSSILAGAAGLAVANGFTRRCSAIEPIHRPNNPSFKFSLAAYSYRDLFRANKVTMEEFIDDCAKWNLEGTELTSYFFPPDFTDDYLREVKRRAHLLGLDVSGTAVSNDFCLRAGDERDKHIANVKHWVERAAVLGAPVIRIFAGAAKEGQTIEEARKLAIEGFEECCDYAGTHGVMLALENHGGLTATAEEMLLLVRAVKSPWFGVNLDTGNFHSDDPYTELEAIAPYAVNVQVKASMVGPDRKKTPADYERIAQLLRRAGYRGYIVLEYEDKGDPRVECPKHIERLRAAFA